MFYQIEIFLLGVATVFDTVLLLIVLERVNRAQVSSWLYALLTGLWLIHGSCFAHELLRDVPNNVWPIRFCFGLPVLVCCCFPLPCCMLPCGSTSVGPNISGVMVCSIFRWLRCRLSRGIYPPRAGSRLSMPWRLWRGFIWGK